MGDQDPTAATICEVRFPIRVMLHAGTHVKYTAQQHYAMSQDNRLEVYLLFDLSYLIINITNAFLC